MDQAGTNRPSQSRTSEGIAILRTVETGEGCWCRRVGRVESDKMVVLPVELRKPRIGAKAKGSASEQTRCMFYSKPRSLKKCDFGKKNLESQGDDIAQF